MISLDKKERMRVSALFQHFKWNYLPDSIIEGNMGEVFVDNEDNPQFAVLEIPKLKLFIPGGDINHPAARDFMANLHKFSTLIFASEGWEGLLKEIHAGKFIDMQRFAFTSAKLDIQHLRKLASQIPNGYQLEQIDLKLAQKLVIEKSSFASAHMLNFDSPEDFINRGFGFCILEGDVIISAATTFAFCSKGIEIQISTREKQQRKGLATVVAARLLLHSLERGLDPNWDAENEGSARLAAKLGYIPQGNYYLWLLTGTRIMTGFITIALKIK